jgi:hypothetical protein
MVGELQAFAPTGLTLYAQVNSIVNGQIWNTALSAFQAYATANIGNYDIAMTELGTASGYYTGTFPSGIARGVYSYRVLQQVGGSPAEDDPIMYVGEVNWTGSAATGLVDAPTAAENAAGLLDLADAIETGVTVRESLRAFLAVLCGIVTGAGTTEIVFKNPAGTAVRLTARVDTRGNRGTIDLTL